MTLSEIVIGATKISRLQRARLLKALLIDEYTDNASRIAAADTIWRLKTVVVCGEKRLQTVRNALVELQQIQDPDQDLIAELLAEVDDALDITQLMPNKTPTKPL